MGCCCGGGVGTNCCPGDKLPTTLYLTISQSGDAGLDGTYPLTYSTETVAWIGSCPNGGTLEFTCGFNNDACGLTLEVLGVIVGENSYEWNITLCGDDSGEWESADCSTPQWVSNPSSPSGSPLAATPTFTVTD